MEADGCRIRVLGEEDYSGADALPDSESLHDLQAELHLIGKCVHFLELRQDFGLRLEVNELIGHAMSTEVVSFLEQQLKKESSQRMDTDGLRENMLNLK